MITQHTPGPWSAHWYEKNKRTKGGEWYFVSANGTATQKAVRLNKKSADGAANAHLMALAPELLEAVDKMQTYLAVHGDPNSGTVKRCLQIAAEVLAKVTTISTKPGA